MLYVHGIGIDYEDDMYTVYAQVINFNTVAKSETPSTASEQTEIGHASGKTMDDAIFNLYHSVDQRLFWGHLTYVIFSGEALEKGRMNPVIDLLTRYRETRYQTWIYSTEDSVKDVLLTSQIINTSTLLSKLGDQMNSFKQESFVEPISIRETIIGLNEPSHEVLLPTFSIAQNWETGTGKSDVVKLAGFAVVSRDSFKGFITDEKVRGLRWMNNDTNRSEISIDLGMGNDGNHISIVLEKIKVHVKPVVEKDSVKFDLEVKMNISINAIHGKVTNEEIWKLVEKEVEREVMETYEEALTKDSDVYGLSGYLYRDNIKAWKRFEKDGKVELTEESIKKLTIKVKKVNSGRKDFIQTIKSQK
jgi:spore germination protein KC